MTPKEKWQRLTNPKTLSDYSIGLSEQELRQFPEGRSILCHIKKMIREKNRHKRYLAQLAESAAETLDDQIRKIFEGGFSVQKQ